MESFRSGNKSRVVKSHNRVAEAVYREGGCDSENLKV
jgi:hypothetical protein